MTFDDSEARDEHGRWTSGAEGQGGGVGHGSRQYPGAARLRRTLSVPDQHFLKIARANAKMHPAMAGVLGGPSPDEAKQIVAHYEHHGKLPTHVVGGKYMHSSLEEATQHAGEIFHRTGNVVSVEKTPHG